jgi:hypothetical protein
MIMMLIAMGVTVCEVANICICTLFLKKITKPKLQYYIIAIQEIQFMVTM